MSRKLFAAALLTSCGLAVPLVLSGFRADGGETAAEKAIVYKSPYACALTPDGRKLVVTYSTAGSLGVIDTAQRRVEAEIPVGRGPRAVVTSRDGRFAWVTLYDEGVLVEVDLGSAK